MRKRLPGLVLLALALCYGVQAASIPVLAADAGEAMSARTLPLMLTAALACIGLVLTLRPADAVLTLEPTLSGSRKTRIRAALLLLLCLAFGLLIEPLGVPGASVLLLMVALRVTGITRPVVLVGVPCGMVAVLWFLLVVVLDIYLPTGDLWLLLAGSHV